jgi:hypothetical protein
MSNGVVVPGIPDGWELARFDRVSTLQPDESWLCIGTDITQSYKMPTSGIERTFVVPILRRVKNQDLTSIDVLCEQMDELCYQADVAVFRDAVVRDIMSELAKRVRELAHEVQRMQSVPARHNDNRG